MNNPIKQNISPLWQQARRYFLGQAASVSLGAMALQCLENNSADAAAKINPAIGLPELPHHSPTAKNVIFLTQSG